MNSGKKTQRIGIDCRMSGLQHAGIGRYILNLITRVPSLTDQIEWLYFFYDKNQWQEVQYLCKKLNLPLTNVTPHFVPIRHYTVEEQLRMPGIFHEANLDLLHVPHFNIPLLYQGKIVTTIHDLLWHEFQGFNVTTLPAWKYLLKYQAYKFVTSQAVTKSKLIFVPAQTIKKTLLKYYPNAKNKIQVTYEGTLSIDLGFTASALNHDGKKYKQTTLLYIGSLYPHKNISFVLSVLEHNPNLQLQLIGSRNIFQDKIRNEVKKLKVEKQVKFLGFVPDEELGKVFQTVDALIQPSLSEGFGLTGIEAMSCGLPVLASDIPIFREIYQNGAYFFDPTSIDELTSAIDELSNKTLTNQMVKRAKKIAKQYSWDKMAEETFNGYLQSLTSNQS